MGKAVEPVIEVTDKEELAKLKWWQQGSEELASAEALEKRYANRRNPTVLRELASWWEAAVHGEFTHDLPEGTVDDLPESVDKERYLKIL
jgi:hypothetical protein